MILSKSLPKKNNKDASMPLLGHISELRNRLIISTILIIVSSIIAFYFYDFIVYFLFEPFKQLNRVEGSDVLFVNTILEGFLIKIKVSLIGGIIISMPIHILNIVRFIFPGLKQKEKWTISISLFVGFFLAVFSIYYGYFKIIPLSIMFLTSAGFIPEDIGLLLNFSKNIFYILHFLFITVLLFQLPIFLEALLAMNIIKRSFLMKGSRFIVVIIFVLSAILTPPDLISQISIALPLIILYFLAILIAKIFKFGEG